MSELTVDPAEAPSTTTTDDAYARGFAAAREAAARLHETRADFTRERLAHLEANPSMVPEDVRYDLAESYRESVMQDTLDARHMREMRLPEDADAASRAAEEGQRVQCKVWCDQAKEQRDLARSNYERMKVSRDLARAVVKSLPRCTYAGCEHFATWQADAFSVLCDACIVGCRESAPWLKPTELPYAPALRLWLEAKAAKR